MVRSNLIKFFMLALWVMQIPAARAQTYTVLHAFTGNHDGVLPYGGVALDQAGNVYGTTYGGGTGNAGIIYEVKRSGSNYVYLPLYNFTQDGRTGSYNYSTVTFGRGGALYGMTNQGGYNGCGVHGYSGCGVVFSARPQPTFCASVACSWTVSANYVFQGITSGDGDNPYLGRLAFDQAGSIYGTTMNDGAYGGGTAFQLTRSGDTWSETILHQFGNTGDGKSPRHSVVIDSGGNLYGTTATGGANQYGTVFQLVPSGSGWTENILYNFSGGAPAAGVIVDAAGNLYGATLGGGDQPAVVYKLSPSDSGWQFTVLYAFTPTYTHAFGNLALDGQGNLYGDTFDGGLLGAGMIFKLARSGGAWNFTDLYDFTNGNDGANPSSDLTIDGSGILYGTAENGGIGYGGVVWKLAQ